MVGTAGLAGPLCDACGLRVRPGRRWSGRTPPGSAAARTRGKGHAGGRTAAALWEA
ncbi:hypothetical protein ACH4L5_19380 [Streptomyces sp. NPDC017405]|uniref:hypothetical protein n=1 Tax=unclassified Streptomyces TaxID=2593676 RepID=UPI0037ABD6C2